MFIPCLVYRAILDPEVARQIDYPKPGGQQLRNQFPAYAGRSGGEHHVGFFGDFARIDTVQRPGNEVGQMRKPFRDRRSRA
ncbi:hypothetical protein D1872_288160 [compost metagenome]